MRTNRMNVKNRIASCCQALEFLSRCPENDMAVPGDGSWLLAAREDIFKCIDSGYQVIFRQS
jgi:hypothetical protein